ASGSKDLDPAPGFLGRGVELALLARRWLPADGAPVALLEGPPGVGKTALAAEAIQLWQGGFELVLAVQAYGWPLPPGVLLRQALRRLAAARAERHAREGLPPPEPRADVRGSGSPDGALRPEPRADVRGSGSPDEPRFDAYGRPAPLEQELAEALRSERALLVLDGLDGAACDAWAPLLDHLAVRLRGSGSRVLATTRYLAVAGAPDALLRVRLGGLPLNEAALLADRCGPLRDLLRGDGEAAALARRVLDLGRGHPLILLRLGDLAALRGGAPAASARSSGVAPQGGSTFEAPGRAPRGAPSAPSPGFSAGSRSHLRPTGRAALERGLDRLARRLDDGGSAPLEDVAAAVVDLLIELLSPGARRLLWGMTLAGEPVKAWMVEELGAMLLAPDERLRPALEELIESGLASRHAEEARGTAYGFHELVAERAAAWMARCPEEQGGASAEHVWRSYGERYAAAFRNALPMLQQGLFSASSAEPSSLPSSSTPASDPRSRPPAPSSPGPLDQRSRPPPAEIYARTPIPLRRPHELAAELGRRAVRYLVRARAFKALSSFATAAVTMVADAAPLDDVIADLAAAAEHASGEARWRTRIALAAALRNARRVAEALPHYARAASEAEAAARWADVGVIRSKWADALALADRYDDARRMYEASAEAKRRAGRPRVSALAAELEALRMDVARGAAAEAEPAIRAHVDRLHGYWERRLRGEDLREAPDDAFLADTLAAALDVARRASAALERWEACLDLVDELERLGRAIGAADLDRTQVRFHRVTPLIRLGRLVEAAAVIEVCLEGFRRARELRGEARALSTLAAVRADLGDVEAAVALEREALAVRERSAGPVERAASHARLAALLHRAGVASEAAEHGLAAAAYQLASGHDPHPELRDLAARAAAAPGSPAPRLLRLAALVERPAFLTLRRSLSERGVSVEALQARLDDLFAQAVAAGEGERRPPADIEDDRVPGARSDPDPPAERAAPSSPVEGANRALPIKKSVG
ncbi:MAG: hypothetical protein IT372_34720, partial [Polyangiaceae bacterium]|nr:hypothetical protein [Polyangiaceae bacterium]